MKAKKRPKQGPLKVAALERALSILKVFETVEIPVTLARLSEATGLYKSTILRLLGSFEDFGYIRRTLDGAYAPGPAAFRLGIAYKNSFQLDAAIDAALRKLVAQGTESASFHVLDADRRLCVQRVNSGHSTLDTINVGDVLPLDRGAAGKILRSFTDEADPSLDAVRRQGWAFSDGERDPSCAALAAPVFGMGHELIGAISLSGPRERFTKQTIASMTKLLLDSAAELSRLAINDARARAVSGPPTTSAR
ncbi:MAG: IclR family transcriptional regulator [Rhodopseudomonas sp.]|uniref:IclR family transcriptional regulator n=1 Tax=Rhodopseudomonas sp. TaxID=1078 RepID=UPI00183EB789|nr:IclR family transcriptional regulator [Rhodopseudomonas sp.]NVN87797.1 IclR family transcriptional regulator [Rhodopseudomonas sp.]